MRVSLAVGLIIASVASPAFAADSADPCSAFSWPMTSERALLATASHTPVKDGGFIERTPPLSFALALVPDKNANFALVPQKPPSPTGYGASIGVGAPPAEGDYLVTLSSEGWIDLIQGGASVASTAHSGAMNCPGMRKSVKFHLASGAPLTVQISSAPNPEIDVAITPASN
jgi:hypothetical protein